MLNGISAGIQPKLFCNCEKSRIADLFRQYSYKMTFGTIFSNGSMSDIGEELINIYTYDENNKPGKYNIYSKF